MFGTAFKTLKYILNHPLNTHQSKFAVVSNYIAWQIGSRLVPGPVVVPFAAGTKLLVRPGLLGATGNVYVGLQEFEEMTFTLHMLRTGDHFFDAGANIGSYTVLAAGICGARCIAVEPVRSSYDYLLDNIRLNNIEHKVEALHTGLANQRGELYFTTAFDTKNHVTVLPQCSMDQIVSVSVDTIDNICRDHDIFPALIKIDVEGFEASVIEGAHTVLQYESVQCVIIELLAGTNRYGFDDFQVHNKLLGLGFKPFRYLPFDRKLLPVDLRIIRSGNLLYIRNFSKVSERISSAPRLVIRGCSI